CTRPTRLVAMRGLAPWPYCSMRRPLVAAPTVRCRGGAASGLWFARDLALRRGGGCVLVVRAEAEAADFQAAIAAGAQRVIALPEHDGELMAEMSNAADACRDEDRRGAVVGVIAGRGGAGASVFATALAHTADDALLVDADPWGGGIDLVLGCEGQTGLRWPDLTLQ